MSACELFEGLSEESIDKVVPLCEQVQVSTGVSIINKGEMESDLFVVPSGRINIVVRVFSSNGMIFSSVM